jgi:hypothetical protein
MGIGIGAEQRVEVRYRQALDHLTATARASRRQIAHQ